jgi:hypothetical protein
MKQLAILVAVIGLSAFMANDAFAQRGYGGHGGGHGHRGGYHGGGTAWGVSIGNGYGNGFSFGQGPRGNSFYGLNVGGGGYGYARPVYAAPVYRPVYGGGYGYGGYGGYGRGRGCGW